jgi:hypothetical protein
MAPVTASPPAKRGRAHQAPKARQGVAAWKGECARWRKQKPPHECKKTPANHPADASGSTVEIGRFNGEHRTGMGRRNFPLLPIFSRPALLSADHI